jgi:PAS domain S-box-containing protein
VAHPVIPSSFSVTEFAPVALWATNAAGACVAMAGAWERFTGRPANAAAGDGWLAFVHEKDRVRLKATLLAANARRESFEAEARIRRPGGQAEWVRIFGAPQFVDDTFRGFTGCAVRAEAIRSERQAAERDRRALGLLADLAWDALVVTDAEGRIVRTNAASRQLFAVRAGVEGEPLDRFVPDWMRLLGDLDEAPTLDVSRGDGSVVTTRARSVSVLEAAGGLPATTPSGPGPVAVALRRVDPVPPANERRGMEPGTVAADLLHDLSNVVTALLAGCELARMGLPPGHPVHAEIAELAENVKRAQDLTVRLKPPERGKGDPDAASVESGAERRPASPDARPSSSFSRRRKQESLPSEVLRGRSILVVDDEMSIRRSVRAAFEAAGAEVHDARHGADALLMWSELRGRVDLVVTDLRMPEMGGDELAERLRRLRRDLPILFVSGYALDRRVRRRPGDGFLAKPFAGDDLIEAASQVVVQPGAGA